MKEQLSTETSVSAPKERHLNYSPNWHLNASEQLDAFRNAMISHGFNSPHTIVGDGQLKRFSTNDNPRDDAGWYTVTVGDQSHGAYGNHRDGSSHTWTSKLDRPNLLSEAKDLWAAASENCYNHPYLERKKIDSHGIRRLRDVLLIQVFNRNGFHSLQKISPDGTKRFHKGTSVKGAFSRIGTVTGDVILIGEGVATCIALFEATGYPAYVAFSANNLVSVAKEVRSKYSEAKIIICADDDWKQDANPGLAAGLGAAAAVGGLLAKPLFDEPREHSSTDFNDLAVFEGGEKVKAIIEDLLTSSNQPTVENIVWPEPKSIDNPLKPVIAFDAEALLPPPLRDYVVDEARRINCPIEFIAAFLLSVLGSLIGTKCSVAPKSNDSWLVLPNIWCMLVGTPSSKKTPSMISARRALDRLIASAKAEFDKELTTFEENKALAEAHAKKVSKEIKDHCDADNDEASRKSAKRLVELKRTADSRPTKKRYRINDSTSQKVGELLIENPNGLLVERDELAGLISAWEQEGGEGDRAFYMEGYNGTNSYDIDRIQRGSMTIPNHCLTVGGATHPAKLLALLKRCAYGLGNDGMLQRFALMVFPDPVKYERHNEKPNPQLLADVCKLFADIDCFKPTLHGAAPIDDEHKFPYFTFSEAGDKIQVEFCMKLNAQIEAEDSHLIQQHLAKYEKLFPALAEIFHVVDCVANGANGPISAEAAVLAESWCILLESHARRCYGLLLDGGKSAAKALSIKLEKQALRDGFTAREVDRHQWQHLSHPETVSDALNLLEDDGWIVPKRVASTPKGGRPTTLYYINPKIYSKKTREVSPEKIEIA